MQEKLLAVAKKAAHKAGHHLLEGFGEVRKVQSKSGPNDLVTPYDHSTQELITGIIQDTFPNHSILSEEGLDVDKSSTRWIIDPIDGTTNYVYSHPFFAVSIAVESEGELNIGVVHVPRLGETFTAVRGEGARLNGDKLRVSSRADLQSSLLSTGFPYEEDLLSQSLKTFIRVKKKVRGIRRGGSAAIDLAFVAAGRFDGFWEFGLSSWDVAAGLLLVEEAGGIISNHRGRSYDLYRSESIVASNGRIHDELKHQLSAEG